MSAWEPTVDAFMKKIINFWNLPYYQSFTSNNDKQDCKLFVELVNSKYSDPLEPTFSLLY